MTSILRFIFRVCITGALLLGGSASAQTPALIYKLQDFFALMEHDNPGVSFGVQVVELDGGKAIFSLREREQFVPASVLKVITSYTALRILGSSYRFPTEIFLDFLPKEVGSATEKRVDFTEPAKSVGNLYVRGYGDPTFDSHRMHDLALAVRRYGVQQIDDVVVDDSLFMNPPRASGEKAHEAALSAVTVNFNTYGVAVAPSASGLSARVSIDAGLPYTLLNQVKTGRGTSHELHIYQSPGSTVSAPGADDPERLFFVDQTKVRIVVQGSVAFQSSGQTFYRSVPDAAEHFAALLKYELQSAGVTIKGKIRRGETPSQAKLLQTIESEELGVIVRQLNQFSNNVIAGQLIFAIGQAPNGYFDYERGLERLRNSLEKLDEGPESFVIVDGSGLDKRNRLSAEQVVKVLSAAYGDFSIAPDFIASLSRFGQSGTLKPRELLDSEYAQQLRGEELQEVRRRSSAVWGKTGTLDSVSSLAGYAETDTGVRLAYAILMNNVPDKDRAIRIENEMSKILVGLPVPSLVPKAVPGEKLPLRPPIGASGPAGPQQTPVAAPVPEIPANSPQGTSPRASTQEK